MTTDLWMLVWTALLALGLPFIYLAGLTQAPGGAAWGLGNRTEPLAGIPEWAREGATGASQPTPEPRAFCHPGARCTSVRQGERDNGPWGYDFLLGPRGACSGLHRGDQVPSDARLRRRNARRRVNSDPTLLMPLSRHAADVARRRRTWRTCALSEPHALRSRARNGAHYSRIDRCPESWIPD